jgi:phage shock protein E
LVLVLTAVLLVGVGCSGDDDDDEEAAAAVDLVAPEEFEERMGQRDAVVINVHVPYEGEIADTDLFIPFDRITASNELPEDRDLSLVVYCRSGNMSADATADLIEMGYTDVTDLDGGMVAWEESGRGLTTDPARSEAAATGG